MALVLGTAGLPHVLMRFYTVPTRKQARKSVEWAIWLIGLFYLFTLVLGFGAAALVGPEAIKAAPGKANSAAPLLAFELGGELLLGVISAVAFATILAVVAGLTITASASFAHDIYNEVFKHGQRDRRTRRSRSPASHRVVIGASPSSVASSPRARTSRSSWPWPSPSRRARTCRRSCTRCSGSGFNTRGALWSIYGGLIERDHADHLQPGRVGQAADPVEGGPSPSMLTNAAIDFHLVPARQPGPHLDPAGFLLGWLGTVTSKEHNAQKYAEMEVRSLTGHGAAEAVNH